MDILMILMIILTNLSMKLMIMGRTSIWNMSIMNIAITPISINSMLSTNIIINKTNQIPENSLFWPKLA